MTRPTHPQTQPDRLRTVVRALAWWHVVVAVVVVAAGVFFCYAYFFLSEPDDNLAGVALILGVIALVLGLVSLALAGCSLVALVRRVESPAGNL